MSRRVVVAVLALLLAAGACKKKAPVATNVDAQNKVAVRTVSLFFESPNMVLAPESRNLPLPESPAGALSVLMRELAKGPANPQTPRLLPADTVIRGTYLLPGGTALVDLGGATLTQGWGTGSHQELMAVYSIVQTATANVPEVKRVRILMNGGPAETLAGHISLSRSLVPAPALTGR